MTREQPRQNPPPVQRLRVRYAKRGRLRFTSHRDVSRAVERAVVRARLPMAYSSGFNPHPRISYAGAAPTGAASEAEYLELALAERLEPEEVRDRLGSALPDGIDVTDVVEAGSGSLADRLQVSRWRMRVEADPDAVRTAVEAFLAADAVPVERMTKKGLRGFDARAAVERLEVLTDGRAHDSGGTAPAGCITEVDVVLRHTEPAVRPDDVIRGLAVVGGLSVAGVPLLTRLAQGPLDTTTGAVGDPFATPGTDGSEQGSPDA